MTTADAPAQIVLVEDDKTVNNLLNGFLRRRSKVISFFDLATALRTLTPSDERTIFVIDYRTPASAGPALKKEFESRFPCAKYLLTCGVSTANLAAVGQAAGFDAVLAKPYRLPDLMQKISEVDQQWPE